MTPIDYIWTNMLAAQHAVSPRCEKEVENVLKFPGNVTALLCPIHPASLSRFPPMRGDTATFCSPRLRAVGSWYSSVVLRGLPQTTHEMQVALPLPAEAVERIVEMHSPIGRSEIIEPDNWCCASGARHESCFILGEKLRLGYGRSFADLPIADIALTYFCVGLRERRGLSG